jgi:hypothetical protein
MGQDWNGKFLPGDDGTPAAGAELLTPESREFRSAGAGILRGVPVPYRRDAEAYFRRLAEDEAKQ